MHAVSEPDIPTRQSLLARLKDWQDKEGWLDFFNTYWRLIHGVALRAGLTESEAQDVVQETLLEIARKMPAFRYDPALGSFKSWLLHTTRWKISGQFRRRKRQSREVCLEEETPSATAPIERFADPASVECSQAWDKSWEQSIFEAALENVKGQVSAIHYGIFHLHVCREQTVRQTAAALQVSPAMVYLAKHRVGRLLKREILRIKKNFDWE